jgi:hypothetical protein
LCRQHNRKITRKIGDRHLISSQSFQVVPSIDEIRCLSPIFGYPAPQHFLYLRPLPQGQESLRPVFDGAERKAGAGTRCRDTNLDSGARLCRKKRFNPAQR